MLTIFIQEIDMKTEENIRKLSVRLRTLVEQMDETITKKQGNTDAYEDLQTMYDSYIETGLIHPTNGTNKKLIPHATVRFCFINAT